MRNLFITLVLGMLSLLPGVQPSQAKSPKAPSSLEILKELIPIDTTNPPGNETAAMEWVQNFLSQYGIPSKIVSRDPKRGNLIARLPGSSNEPGLVLLAHLDVVGATAEEWSFPPLQATESQGYLYGRGAIDMKGQAALMMSAFIKLHLSEQPLKREVLLVLVADEESGGKYGAEFLVEEHLEELNPALVINEGSIAIVLNGMNLYPIQVAEKGVAWLKLTARGESGHGSMPSSNNATLRLIRALDKISEKPQPIQETPIVAAFLKGVARELPFPKSFLVKNFFSPPVRTLASWMAGPKIEANKFFNAMLRNTVVPTVLAAGNKTNVIPPLATAEVDCRLLPGTTPEKFREEIIAKIDDPKIKVDFLTESQANESPFETRDFQLFQKAILKVDPKAVVVPFISPGATDMRFFREKGIVAYGIIPLLVQMEDLSGLHGKDERVPLEQLPKGEQILFEFIKLWQEAG